MTCKFPVTDRVALASRLNIQLPQVSKKRKNELCSYELSISLTATRPWSCVSGHPDESSYIPPPPSPVRAADSGACCADQAAYP